MSSDCSSPSPPASSSLKAPTLADAPEVREDMEIETPSSSAAVNFLAGTGLDMSAFQFQNNPAFQALLASGLANQKVKQEAHDTPSSSTTTIDLAALKNHPTFQSIMNNSVTTDNANLTIAKLFGAAGMKTDGPWSPMDVDTPKKSRLKVFANGYFMTFDKVSSCQKKHFWRCEYKNTCKARMHTDILTGQTNADPMQSKFKILTFIHEHNHSPPTTDEIKLYGLNPDKVEHNQVYLVGNTADPNQRRKIRKQVAEQEAANKKMEAQKQIPFLAGNLASIVSSESQQTQQPSSSSSYISPNLPLQSSTLTTTTSIAQPVNLLDFASVAQSMSPLAIPAEPTRSGPVKRRPTTSSEDSPDAWMSDPLFEPTFEIARKLRKLWKGEPKRYPRKDGVPTRHFEFYLSRSDGFEEHLYVPLRIEQRDETHLKEALQDFCGQQCIGLLLFAVSPKISVMFNQPMLSNWDNNQFFLLDDSNPSRWRLMYVDDKAL
uniref:FLYWCH-type domain-containing protein n=1 Tax=Caenorhabditis japonica TaxID=281687 RepID=A0A8R1DZQ1_CAEJA